MPNDGFVYVMSRDDGHLKVGFSPDPGRRLFEVEGARSVVAQWQHPQAYRVERAAHRVLRAYRRDGEWFAAGHLTVYQAVIDAMATVGDQTMVGGESIPSSDGLYRIGYARDFGGVSDAEQTAWLLQNGIPEQNVYVDIDGLRCKPEAALKDAREDDIFACWSPEMLDDRAITEARLSRNGVRTLYNQFGARDPDLADKRRRMNG